ncbi:MAG TPA: hypothetical protein VIP77_15990 [Jiangellaceae bacterium]
MTFPVRVEVAEGLLAKMEQLRAENAELRMLLGWIEQSHTLPHVKNLIAEFKKAPDFPAHKNGEHR